AQVCGHDANDAIIFIEEPCPIGSLCASGQCAPSPGATACVKQSDCPSGQACVPLVDSGALTSVCVTSQPAPQIAGASCSQDSDCQTYHCLQLAQGRYCLLACGNDLHCPATLHCRTLNATISGVQGMVGSCGP